jgi:hypothetical protein
MKDLGTVQLPFPDMKNEIFSDGHDDYMNSICRERQGRLVREKKMLFEKEAKTHKFFRII